MSSHIPSVYLGIDIAKDSFQFYLSDRVQGKLPNTPAGFRRLFTLIDRLKAPVHALCEASGGYERALVQAFHQAHRTISLLNPARVRHFAKSLGLRAKTDPLDARLLARFGQRLEPPPTVPRSAAVEHLRELVRYRDQLVTQRLQLENQLEHLPTPLLRRGQRTLLRQVERQLKALEAAIHTALKEDAELRSQARALQEETGVAETSAAVLLAELPELGTLNRRAAAALAGVAPYNHDSGPRQGHRFISGGRPRVRRALYMCALVASRHHPQLKLVYQRLIQRGKPAKVALVALMRHLVIRLNHRLKNQ